MNVTINGNIYHLKAGTGVKRTPLNEWAENIRFDGTQKRKDKRLISTWAFDTWAGGLGIKRINVDNPKHLNRLWDVEYLDTRWNRIIAAPALQTPTIVPSCPLDYIFEYLGNVYFASRAIGTSGTGRPDEQLAYEYLPPDTISANFAGLGTNSQLVASTGSLNPFGGGLLGVYPDGEGVYLAYQSSILRVPSISEAYRTGSYGGAVVDGNTLKWCTIPAQAGGIGFSTLYPVEMAKLGGTFYAMSYVAKGSAAGLFGGRVHMMFPILGTNGGSFALGGTYETLIGTYLPPLLSDGAMVYAALPDGIYKFKEPPAPYIDTSQSQDRNCNQAFFDGNIHVKNNQALIKYDGTDLTPVGYDRDDGLPSDKMGEITAMTSSMRWLFAAVKGATYSHILTKDKDNAWQYYSRVPTPGIWIKTMKLSALPDGIQRLWCIFGNHGYPGFFYNPLIDPLQKTGTYQFNDGVQTTYFITPEFDGGVIEDITGFYDLTVTGKVHNQLQGLLPYYGLNGDNPIASLGNMGRSPASRVGTFPINPPYGTVGNTIQIRIQLTNGGAASTAYFDGLFLHYLKIPKTRELFEFDVDLDETANEESRPYESVIGSLDYERSSVALIPFWYGQIATRKVRIIEEPFEESIENQNYYEGERQGLVHLRCFEVI